MLLRVRFAPSPTGMLHIGNARTVLINWLFAQHFRLKGQETSFLLRLDDTDQERSKEMYAQSIYEDLSWLGITHDMFFKQSDRFDRYHEVMETLKKQGLLYACYETPEELDFKRKRQLSRKEPPIYDRTSLNLTTAQQQAFEAEGRKPYWRFKLNNETVAWHDLVRGDVSFHGNHLSDPVLVRADGAFLYTFTSVVDDVDSEVTHILRGEDHVTNTAVQIQLFKALGKDLTNLSFAHTTLLVGAMGESLSKRLGSLSINSLREIGLEPMAINSLLARLGTSLPIEPRLTLDELAKDFSLNTFSRTPPRFDLTELETLNHKLYALMSYADVQSKLNVLGYTHINEQIWQLVRSNIHTLKDIPTWLEVFFGNLNFQNDLSSEEKIYLQQAFDNLPSSPWNETTWGTWTQELKEQTGRKGKMLYMPLRHALTGMEHGPEMKELLPLIGHDIVSQRLQNRIK